jgi:hypothetical protein
MIPRAQQMIQGSFLAHQPHSDFSEYFLELSSMILPNIFSRGSEFERGIAGPECNQSKD